MSINGSVEEQSQLIAKLATAVGKTVLVEVLRGESHKWLYTGVLARVTSDTSNKFIRIWFTAGDPIEVKDDFGGSKISVISGSEEEVIYSGYEVY